MADHEDSCLFSMVFSLTFSLWYSVLSLGGVSLVCILPHYKLFETQAQFIVVTEEFWVRWDLIQEDLGHLQWALQQGVGGERRKGTKTKRQS